MSNSQTNIEKERFQETRHLPVWIELSVQADDTAGTRI
jgi:hypothetical protein